MHLMQSSRRRNVAARLEVERLESRTVLSTLVWSNRGTCTAAPCGTTDGDMYFARFGANAAAARNVTDAVLAAWGTIIQEFNYTNVGQPLYAPQANTYFLSISG